MPYNPSLCPSMLLVEFIDHCSSGLHNLYTARGIRMAAYGDRIVLDGQANITAIDRRYRFSSDLLSNMLFHIFQLPRPNIPISTSLICCWIVSPYFLILSITSIPSALYFTSPYISAQNLILRSFAACSICVPARPKTGIPFGIPFMTATATS